jgi:MSHA biogenesis protein MshQ
LNGPAIAGTPTNLSTTSSSNLVFGGSTAGVSVPAGLTVNNLTISNTSAVSQGGDLTVAGTLTLSGGTFSVGANTLTLNGSAIAGAASNLSTTSSSSLAFGGNAAGISVPSSISALNNLTINNANGVSLSASLTLGGTLTLNSGTLTVGTSTLTLNGPAIAGTTTNLITSSGSSLAFGGSSTGVSIPSSVTALKNLTINNANGVTANGNITVGGLLALTSGALTTGANKIAVSGNCSSSSSMTRGTGYVIGYLKLTFPSGSTTTCTYHVGTGTSYAPIGVTMVTPSIIGGGTLTGTTVGAEHPQIASSSIDPTKDVNRYWSLWASGDSINFTSYAVTLNFATGDPDAIATPTSFVVGKYVGSAWSSPTPVTAGSTSTSISSQTAALTSTTDFAAGETAFVCSTPSDLPSGMSCVCDSFARAVLNPSTIFDGDWVVSDSGTTQFTPKIVNTGYFRLTSNQTNVATRATMPGTFPAAGNMVTVEFKHYAYNTTTTGHATGADGMALTLSDSSITPVPGAYGGSLGYAQKTGIPGFAGGWIGVGIDEYGNYAIEGSEGRFGGVGTSLVPNSITIRGSGSGSAYQNNYPFLATTGSLTTAVSDPSSTNPSRGHAYRIVVDARCYQRDTNANGLVCNNASLAKKTQVTVYRNTSGAATFNSSNKVIDFDAYSTNAAQSAVPSNWKLSFTAGTGSVTNIHEISGIRICAATIVPPSGFRIQIDNSNPSTCATAGGNPAAPIVTITAVDASDNVSTSYTGTVTLSTKLQNGSSTAAVWAKKSGNGTFNSSTNQYQFVAADNGTAQFYLTDASTQDVYVSASDGSISSSASSPVQFSGGLFTMGYPDSLGTSVVAGRAHKFSLTRTTCSGGLSSTDTSYTGTKSLDGWYNVDSDHPSGAAAPQICQTNASGTCIGGTGTCTTLAIAAPVLSATNNNLSLQFSSGVANFCMVTTDVGKYSLSARDDSNVSSPVVGSTLVLTPRPLALAVTGIKQVGGSATVNPSGTATSGNKFIAAGDTFQATVGAYLWSAAADSNVTGGDGVLDTGATLSALTAGGLAPSFRWPVTLSTVSGGFTPTIGTDGTLMNGTIGAASFSSGSATDSLLTYSEVGSFTLSAKATGFLNSSGVDVNSGVFDSTGARNAVVGRFYPDHFTLTSGSSVTAACTAGTNPFTYLGQPFSYSFGLEARTKNVSGSESKTTKYDSSAYSNAAATTAVMVAENNNDGIDRASNTSMNLTQPGTPATWSLGTYLYSTSAASFTRPSTPSGTFELMQLGVKVTGDADGAVLGGRDMDAASTGDCTSSGTCTAAKIGGGTSIHRFGRLRLDNAVGSELLDLPIPARTEYWNGSVFITNTDDKCTTIPSSSISLQNYQSNITNSSMSAQNNLSITGAFDSGKMNTSKLNIFKLKKPNPVPPGKGSVDVCIRLGTSTTCNASSSANMPWLQGKWNPGSSTYSDDPVSRATFGIYKGGPIIYLRELH